MDRAICRFVVALGIVAALGTAASQAQLPTVPGFEVSVYATVDRPIRLSFDPGTGDLYAGRDLSDPRAPTRIHRIRPGGSIVEEYGAGPIADPDAVFFDGTGIVAGAPGSVLVGGLNASPPDSGSVSVIAANQTVSVLNGPTTAYLNPSGFALDSQNRLLFVDAGIDGTQPLSIHALVGGVTSALITFPVGTRPLDLAVDASDRIYSSSIGGSTIQRNASDGTLLESAFATDLPEALLAFGRGGSFGGSLYAIAGGDLVRVDEFGGKTVMGTGFGGASGMAFGPGGALYVSERSANRILRIRGISSGPGSVPSPTVRMDKLPDPAMLQLSWAPSCSPGSENYAIYAGTIGSWYSHSPVTCSHAGVELEESVDAGSGDLYFLVVPVGADEEGSYGADSSGLERPVGSNPCALDQAPACP